MKTLSPSHWTTRVIPFPSWLDLFLSIYLSISLSIYLFFLELCLCDLSFFKIYLVFGCTGFSFLHTAFSYGAKWRLLIVVASFVVELGL